MIVHISIKGDILMKKLISVSTILVAFAVIILAVMHFVMDRSYIEVQQWLVSILMFLSAYKHVKNKGERDITFWLLIIAGTFSMVVNLIILQPFF